MQGLTQVRQRQGRVAFRRPPGPSCHLKLPYLCARGSQHPFPTLRSSFVIWLTTLCENSQLKFHCDISVVTSTRSVRRNLESKMKDQIANWIIIQITWNLRFLTIGSKQWLAKWAACFTKTWNVVIRGSNYRRKHSNTRCAERHGRTSLRITAVPGAEWLVMGLYRFRLYLARIDTVIAQVI